MINQALSQLQQIPERTFLVRAYDVFLDEGDASDKESRQTPVNYSQYVRDGRKLDLVISYHSRSADIVGYCAFVEALVERHSAYLETVQIGEECNVVDNPRLDGFYPGCIDALIAGVHTAKATLRKLGSHSVKVGCNSSPLIGPAASFFAEVTRAGGEEFIAALDYVGLDFFPDVFRPIANDRLSAHVLAFLKAHRSECLASAGLGHLSLVITEHGWPTGLDRSFERQADVISTVIETIADAAEALNITGYVHHSLRDSSSSGTSLLSRFGLLMDDYLPKPGFETYRQLIYKYSI